MIPYSSINHGTSSSYKGQRRLRNSASRSRSINTNSRTKTLLRIAALLWVGLSFAVAGQFDYDNSISAHDSRLYSNNCTE